MSRWPVFTVENLVEAGVLERPIDGNHGEIHPKANDFVATGVPFIMASDLIEGRVDLTSCSFISPEQANTLRKGFARTGDVLLSHKATIGRTAIVHQSDFPFLVLTPQVTYYRIKDRKRLSPRYLRAYFDSREFQGLLGAWAGAGSTRAYLGITAQLRLPICLPPIEVQNDIADAMLPIDDKLDANRHMNETLAALARELFRDWFVSFGPVRAAMKGEPAYLDPDIWSLFPNEFDLEGLPKGWTREPLDQTATFLNGLALQKYPAISESSLPVIKIAQLRSGNVTSAERASTDLPKDYIVEDGDILFSWSGSLLQRVWTAGPGALNQHLFKVTSSRVPKWFFFHWIAEHMPSFRAIAASKATTMGHIQRHHLTQASVVLASPGVMKAADDCFSPLFDKQVANDLESRTLSSIRDLLLPEFVNGNIRLREVMKSIEGAL